MHDEKVMRHIITALLVYGCILSLASAAVIDIPQPNATLSGISVVSGWKCEHGALTGRIDGGAAFPLAGGLDRPDTAAGCNDANNGWVAVYNYNRLTPGTHSLVAYDGAAEFARVTFAVAHFGVEMKTGVAGTGTARLNDGSVAGLTWSQSQQAFTITSTKNYNYTGNWELEGSDGNQSWTGFYKITHTGTVVTIERKDTACVTDPDVTYTGLKLNGQILSGTEIWDTTAESCGSRAEAVFAVTFAVDGLSFTGSSAELQEPECDAPKQYFWSLSGTKTSLCQ